ncbi:MAG: hypothetical protein ABH986_01580 [archaeon]
MKEILIIGLIGLILFSACTQQQPQKEYVCSDGTTVSNPDACPKEKEYTGRPIGTEEIFYGQSCNLGDAQCGINTFVSYTNGEHISLSFSCENGQCKTTTKVVLCNPERNTPYNGCTNEKPICINGNECREMR